MIELNETLVIDTKGRICKMLRVGDADWDFENPIATIDDIVTIAGGYMSSDDRFWFKLELEKLLTSEMAFL